MTTAKSYKVEVKVGTDPWCGNGLRFASEQEANEYGNELLSRWTLPEAFRVVESDEAANYQMVDGHARSIQ